MDDGKWGWSYPSFFIGSVGFEFISAQGPTSIAWLGNTGPQGEPAILFHLRGFFRGCIILVLILVLIYAVFCAFVYLYERLRYGHILSVVPRPPDPPPSDPTARFTCCKGCFCSTPGTRIFRPA